jgi:alpha-N-acetylglucosaminidase
MKQLFLLAASLLLLAGCAASPDSGPEAPAARALAERVLGKDARHFVFRTIDADSDVFRIESQGRKTVISGNNANSMAVGLNHYLKYFCNVNVGWFVWDEVVLPEKFPVVAEPIEIKARVEERFFLNYCTFGYTMPWWHWDEWEHFIDWMALNGVNLPLAITGQESIWYQVWTELGLSDEEVRNYFTGPAHLPWHRMLNIDRWGGPLPVSWLVGQEKLQKQIVARERELNMKPVLPAFAGHVPPELQRLYPDAQIDRMSDWAGFDEDQWPHFLDPMDPLFPQIQKKFLEKEIEIYGTDHIYGIDLFNEMIPKSWDPEYLARVSRQTYESLAAADPEGTWLQMTWLFYNERQYWTPDKIQPYITSYPADKSLLLDYYCERMEVWQRTDRYYGVPYIWCYLGNFGGNTYLAGNPNEVNKLIENTFANGGENFRGIGSTLEGFDVNPFMYQYIFEKAWDFDTHKDLDAYARVVADSRTGKADENARKAWSILFKEIYHDRSVPGHSPLMNLRPSFGRSSSYHSSVRYTYDNDRLREAIQLLLAADGRGSAYAFDVVNLTRQWLSNNFDTLSFQYKEAYDARDRERLDKTRDRMLAILDEMDRLLGSQTYFLVGKWIADARGWGADATEANYFESNARDLLTSWGDRGNMLTDYANRTLSGLVGSYYKGRWELFFDAVEKSLDAGEPLDEPALTEAYKDWEYAWWHDRPGSFPSEPVGDGIALARQILSE